LSSLPNLFFNNLLPIILIASIGFILQRTLRIDPRGFSRVIFYSFTPIFIFSILASAEIEANEMLRMMGLAIVLTITLGVLSFIISRAMKLEPRSASAFILTVTFINAGNYGLSLNSFALGDVGLLWASIFFITGAMLLNSAGVYVATVGRASPKKALIGLLKVPSVYAIPLALLVRIFDIDLPLALWRPIDLVSSAAVPSMLILLGMQIARAGLPKRKDLLLASVGLRMLASPLIAWFLTPIMGLSGVGRQAGILQAAMPTAVLTTVISMEYDAEPEFVTGVVLVTTLISPFTLTPLLAMLGV
jgi:predicted permease